ncbi:MAG: AMP-binding protein, partial [Betaproteobacteria bacterium]
MIRATMQRMPLSVNQLLERGGRLYPESQIVSRLPDKSLVRHRFSDLYRRARGLAAALLAAGLRKGDRVATLCWNHHAHLECYFGIPAAGGVLHTLNLRLSPDEISWIAGHAKDRFLIVDDILLPLYRQLNANFEKVIVVPFSGSSVESPFIDYESFLDPHPEKFAYAPHEEDDPVAMCYTSGTTGRPKGVVYSHRSTVIHTLMANQPDHWGLSATDSVLPATPMFHANCWGVPYACVMMGIRMIFPGPHLHPEDLLDLFAAEQPTYALGVPTIWLSMLQLLDCGKHKLPPNMRMLVGGAPVPEAMIRAYKRHGAQICHGWGMTEMSPLGTVSFIKPELQHLPEEERFARYALAGVPAPIMDIRLIGDDGAECSWDGKSAGEVQVRGPFIAGGYHDAPADAEKFTADGWLRTGDVATMDAHGYLRITDR